ncbi:trehalose-phosphate phosphatase B-like isoform X2 [Contarinia nasturtii]|nr:trehalose-phosphate phosphatase B-like isoform X2 [Contarinia nasturtii]XP_031623222.1 trehalose-phosphate phosphatase B-like isoform X2 [Contarinia nasturtii]
MAKVVPTVSDIEQINDILSSYVGKDDKLALLLDFDGTLAPLASHPDKAEIDPDSEAALFNLVTNPNIYLAIISGRGADNAREKVKIEQITYAGNHGLEIQFNSRSNKTRYQHEIDEKTRQNYNKMVTELETKLGSNGGWVEDKKQSLTFHYRDVPEIEQPTYKSQATSIIQSYGFIANPAHAAVEAKPPVVWNKGEAALYILRAEFGDDWSNKVKVIFAGDDTTDEDAMHALKGAGLSFRVSSRPEIETNADYRVPSTKTISLILQWLQDTMNQV